MRPILIALCLCAPAFAGHPCRVQVAVPIIAQPYYYQVSSQAPAPYVAPSDVNGILNSRRELERLAIGLEEIGNQGFAERLRLRQQLQALTVDPNQPIPLQEHPAVGILRNRCAGCHGQRADGGFSLFQGDALTLDVAGAELSAGKIMLDSMPKKTPLSDEEKTTVLDWLKSQVKGANP